MRKSVRFVSGLALLLFLVSSCGDTSLLNPADTATHSLEVKSISEGETIQSNTPVIFRIDSPEQDELPFRLDVNLFSSDGDLVADQTIEDPDVDTDLRIELPPLATGRYRIEFMLYGDGTVLVDKELTFFYAAGRYSIQGVESFPPVIAPGSTVLLRAQLGVPEGAAPYIRWKQGAATLEEGPVSDGLDSIYWTAPEEDGVYTIGVELFPVAPGSGESYDFSSSIAMKTELYASSANGAPNTDFSPEESYFSLFHFSGNLEDSAPPPADSAPPPAGEEIGDLLPAVHENILGFRFADGSGFSVPRMIIPFSYDSLQPFTLSMGISWTTLTPGASIIRVTDDQGSFILEVTVGEDQAPTAALKAGGTTYEFASGITDLQLRRRYLLSLSLKPDAEAGILDVHWFLDNRPLHLHRASTGELKRGGGGLTVVGGPGGFDGILDELGVYDTDENGQPSVDPSYF